MPEPPPLESDVFHEFKNHLFIVATYCKLMLAEVPEDDPRCSSLKEMDQAIRAAVALLPDLAKRMP